MLPDPMFVVFACPFLQNTGVLIIVWGSKAPDSGFVMRTEEA